MITWLPEIYRGGGTAKIRLIQYVFGYVNIPLKEVVHSLNTGLNPRRFFQLNTDDATNHYITIREIRNGKIIPNDKTDKINDDALKLCNNRSNLEIGDVLFSGTGTIGETAVIKSAPDTWNIKEGVYSIKPIQNILTSNFLHYWLNTNYAKQVYSKKIVGGTVKSIPMGDLKELVIPLPPMYKQQKIVDILDRFDNLCNSITSGIPAHISAVEKQYEYYRNRLLSFNKK